MKKQEKPMETILDTLATLVGEFYEAEAAIAPTEEAAALLRESSVDLPAKIRGLPDMTLSEVHDTIKSSNLVTTEVADTLVNIFGGRKKKHFELDGLSTTTLRLLVTVIPFFTANIEEDDTEVFTIAVRLLEESKDKLKNIELLSSRDK